MNVRQRREGTTLWLGIELTAEGKPSGSGENLTIATESRAVPEFVHPVSGAPVRVSINAYTKNPAFKATPEFIKRKQDAIAARYGLKPAE